MGLENEGEGPDNVHVPGSRLCGPGICPVVFDFMRYLC